MFQKNSGLDPQSNLMNHYNEPLHILNLGGRAHKRKSAVALFASYKNAPGHALPAETIVEGMAIGSSW